jgi:hypothetical protein
MWSDLSEAKRDDRQRPTRRRKVVRVSAGIVYVVARLGPTNAPGSAESTLTSKRRLAYLADAAPFHRPGTRNVRVNR